MYLSIIIPAYNEAKRIASTLGEIEAYMEGKGVDYEVIVVDDGSSDRTSEAAGKSPLLQAGRLKVLRNGKNSGKGYSVKRGVEEASGEYILFSDADLSTPISEMDKLVDSIKLGADIAIGSRSIGASQIVVRQPFYRQTMGRVFNLLLRGILGERFRDTQCGFKLFKRDVAKSLFSEVTIDGFAFDAEVIYLAKQHAFRIDEIGVKWVNSPDSKVHPLFSSLQMLRDIFKIKLVHK